MKKIIATMKNVIKYVTEANKQVSSYQSLYPVSNCYVVRSAWH